MASEETERICFNCSFFFTASEEFTEYGICLNDQDFDPYIEELMDNLNFASCRDIIEKKKFPGETEACEEFEEAEIIEIDDDSPLGELLNHLKETGELDREKLNEVIFEEQLKHIDLKTLAVKPHQEMLEQGDNEEQKKALRSLGGLTLHGNREAFEVLFKYFKTMPPPERIHDVHRKIEILEYLKSASAPEQSSRLASLLIKELYLVASNNTTRQWITKALQFLAGAPEAEVRQPLETLLKERKFSYRTREKIEAVLGQLGDAR